MLRFKIETAQPLSRESPIQDVDALASTEGNTGQDDIASSILTLRGLRPWHVHTLLVWEPGDVWPDRRWKHRAVARIGKVRSRCR